MESAIPFGQERHKGDVKVKTQKRCKDIGYRKYVSLTKIDLAKYGYTDWFNRNRVFYSFLYSSEGIKNWDNAFKLDWRWIMK